MFFLFLFLFLFLENNKERERERERIDAIVHNNDPLVKPAEQQQIVSNTH